MYSYISMPFTCTFDGKLYVINIPAFKNAINSDIWSWCHRSLLAFSVSCELIGSKSNPIFLPVKIPYIAHSSLNTASR